MSIRLHIKNRMRHRSGFAMVQLMVVMMIMTILAVFGSGELVQKINDGKARDTGRYMVNVRGALIDFQVRHEAFLRGVNVNAYPSGLYAPPPTFINWQSSPVGGQMARGTVADLIADGHLKPSFSEFSPLGERVEWVIHRQGTCSDMTGHANDCLVDAYVYTCHPISDKKSTYNASTSCSAVPPHKAEADGSLVGEVILHAEGYGGTDLLNPNFFVGALIGQLARANIPDISPDQGRVVLAAGLNTTPFAQFVRQGDTRHVFLNDNLTVEKIIESKEGILIDPDTPVVSGASCSDKPEGLYATTTDKTLAVCLGGSWFSLSNYLVRNIEHSVSNGDTVPDVYCPPNMRAWRHIALKGIGYRLTGNDINVYGTLGGNVTGSGTVSQTGSYSINGNFSGSFSNSIASYIDNDQLAQISDSGQVEISDAVRGASAVVIQGCAVN